MSYYFIQLDEDKKTDKNRQTLGRLVRAFERSALAIEEERVDGYLVNVRNEAALPQLTDKVADIAIIYDAAMPFKKRPALRVIDGGRKP